ncbi:MAG: nodulation protein NodN [Novosphingobium sp. 32-60-15]|uniref:MaoC family dehydratase n=1 Tax=unclassified Novosphingobium TaxID=2644732 RepID=UPI000BC483A0|nr:MULTISPECIES: MaoC family dehydratase [unclassified Novosphingobium]OYX61284.1 MAG: nodulation protein NodN [Novosphingobium sp. 32-60-15]
MAKFVSAAEIATMVGTTIGTSPWIEITQDRVNTFAEATGDFQFIHVDPERAKLTPFGGTIAHGFLTLSLLSLMAEQSDCPKVGDIKMGVNYGTNRTRFLAPVRVGKRIRGVFKLLEMEEKRPGQWQQTMEVTVEIEGESKPALMCDWIAQFFV